ncbi:hypothetical protein OESDEN_06847 [Oesophagostomum dentatum]|uniref:Uncharacterized protein n=1 Tax=Oesophagostomum dentatum TaxID=61180 RepID=A0A0B1TD17_OESDE|nr:hypothetical protein OESDEN_06847 [Oesophagostomum dentatum]
METPLDLAPTQPRNLEIGEDYVAEYFPDILSNYSNSSGTISYDSIITPRRVEQREMRFATEGALPNEPSHFAREVELLPRPILPEPIDWDLLKRLNSRSILLNPASGLLEYKERNKKTLEVQRAEKGTMEQTKKVIEQALLKFLAHPTGMAMNISTVPNSKPARLAIKVCPTERMRTPSAPVLTMEALASTFQSDPTIITENELVREQTKLFKKRVQKRQQEAQEAEARKPARPTFPKDPPVHESRSYGPAAMSQDYNSKSD